MTPKAEYDFSHGERGKFFQPGAEFLPPAHLGGEVRAVSVLVRWIRTARLQARKFKRA